MQMVFEDAPQKTRGEFHIEVRRKGKLIDEFHDHNLVVNGGRCRLAELVTGKSTKCITHIGIGSGSEPEDENDTELVEQQLFELSATSVDGRDAKFEFIIGEDEANGLDIREFGLFCSDGTMFSHRVRRNEETGKVSVIGKDVDIELRGYWILHF